MPETLITSLRPLAMESSAWPFQEARRILERIGGKTPAKGYVLFETGYGPSGLPHIGTFGEVARTTMVRRAFELLAPDIPTKLFCVSDDMDGLRKVPDNIPNAAMVAEHLAKPLTAVPDPFGTHESYGHHMNARLRAFLDHFGFEYEFKSATELYKTGAYDAALLGALAHYQEIMDIMIPTLGEERQQTYSPFLPISPKTGHVLYVPMKATNPAKGTVTFIDEDGSEVELSVTGGHCKLQWKPDFGMRWAALDVDFEMYGKDHLTNGKIYSAICSALGGRPPVQFNYELFLDDKGQKISKSKGNGISIEEWLRYAPSESLAYYMYQNPTRAKRLYFDVIPKSVDEYTSFLGKFDAQEPKDKLQNPVWHIHGGKPPHSKATELSYGLILNLAAACNPESPEVLWGFIRRYAPDVTPESDKFLAYLVEHAINYYNDFIKPAKKFREATAQEKAAMEELAAALAATPETSAEALQSLVYEIGKKHGFSELRAWFGALYEVLLGQSQGPRMGSFIALYGVKETEQLIRKALSGALLAAA